MSASTIRERIISELRVAHQVGRSYPAPQVWQVDGAVSHAKTLAECIANGIDPEITDTLAVNGFHDPAGGLPAAPQVGDRWIASSTANGWTENHIYEWNGSTWGDTSPDPGMLVWVESELQHRYWSTVSWNTLFAAHNHDHAALTNLNSASYSHLSATNHTDLTDGGDSALHYHSADRNRANHTGTQLRSTISDFAHDLVSVSHTASGLTAGHFLKATGPAAFAFGAHGLTYTDVGAAASGHTHMLADLMDVDITYPISVSKFLVFDPCSDQWKQESLGLLNSHLTDVQAGDPLRGALIVGYGITPYWNRLALGSNGYFLKSNGTDVVWAAHGLTYTDVGAASSGHNHDHATLTNLNSTSYTHLTASNHTDLTDGGDSALHYHSADRNRANHTGTQLRSTISDFAHTHDSATFESGRLPYYTGTGLFGNSLLEHNGIDVRVHLNGSSQSLLLFKTTTGTELGYVGFDGTVFVMHAPQNQAMKLVSGGGNDAVSIASTGVLTFGAYAVVGFLRTSATGVVSSSALSGADLPSHGVTTNYLPKSNGSNGWSTSSVSDDNTRVYVDRATRIDSQVAFDLSSTVANQDTLYLMNDTAGNLQWKVGPSIGFSASASSSLRHAAIASIQTGADGNQIGLAFYVHHSVTGSNDIAQGLILHHDSSLIQKAFGISWTADQQTGFGIIDNTFSNIGPISSTNGGLAIYSYSKASTNASSVSFYPRMINEPGYGVFHVDGAKSDGSTGLTGFTDTTNPFMRLRNNSVDLFYLCPGKFSATYPAQLFLYDSVASYAANVGSGIAFGGKYNAAGTFQEFGAVGAYKENATDGNYAGYLALYYRAAGVTGYTEGARISSTGKFGINTVSGAAQLSLNGGCHIGGDTDPGDNNLLVDGLYRHDNASRQVETFSTNVSITPTASHLELNNTSGSSKSVTLSGGTKGDLVFIVCPQYGVSIITEYGTVAIGAGGMGVAFKANDGWYAR